MSAIIETPYPADGRGAWPGSGIGGTLRSDGLGPGRFYRHPTSSSVKAPGFYGWQADRTGGYVTLDQYAVWRAVLAVQVELANQRLYSGLIDGLWQSELSAAVRTFQSRNGLTVDGVYGPGTSRKLWEPVVRRYAAEVDSAHAVDLGRIAVGTVALESMFDPGAVGGDPNDLGFGQINGLAHPTLGVNDRLNPKVALPWVCRFIDGNLVYFRYDVDLAVAAYNLGRSGAQKWAAAGRPDVYVVGGKPRDVRAYISKILTGGTV